MRPTARLLVLWTGLLAVDARAQVQDGAPPSAPEAPPPAAIVPPRILRAEDPVYPDGALGTGEHPTVVLQVVIDRTGAPRAIDVEHSAGAAFDAAAREAVAHWTFEPARRGETPIAARIRISVHFELPAAELPTVEAHAHDVVEADDEALDPARHDLHVHPEAAAESTAEPMAEAATEPEPAPDPGAVARARARATSLRPETRAASDELLDRATLTLAPHTDAAAMLRVAPGFVVTRPEGLAVAPRILVRGFDVEHGQDLELSVEGLPLNQPSHLHGQGYADLSPLLPEVIRQISVREGIHDPSQGDFAVAGSVDYRLGVETRGTLASVTAGSFGTVRGLVRVAPEGEDEDTFFAADLRSTRGFGTQRAGVAASAVGQYGFDVGGLRLRALALVGGARGDTAGVVRRDDLDTVGFYGRYDDASARAQNAFTLRVLTALLGTRRFDDGASADFALAYGFSDFRSQTNFTGYTEISRIEPTWRGRGDLVEQRNRASTVFLRFRHRGAPFSMGEHVGARLEVGASGRVDRIEQAQGLLQAPQNETWDRRIDAEVVQGDVGLFADLELELGTIATAHAGVRAEALFTDVADTLGNFVPAYRREDYVVGYRRSALGLFAGPRAAIELHPARGPRWFASYGRGFRSPQAITLEDGERSPFTVVDSVDLGARHALVRDRFTLGVASSLFATVLSDDLVFEPSENRYEAIGRSRRMGGSIALDASAFGILTTRASVTYVHAELRDPPEATAEDPSPPFRVGQALPYVPPVVVRLDLGGRGHVGPADRIGLEGGVGLSYVGARPLPYDERAAPFSTVDAGFTLTYRLLSVGVTAENLLGARYAASEYVFPSNWDPSSVASRIPERHIAAGAPRTVLATLGVRL